MHNSLLRYPSARAMKRRLVYHAGPTNSGKTYHALNHFLSAEYAIYCGPIKMLVHEIFHKSNKQVHTICNVLWVYYPLPLHLLPSHPPHFTSLPPTFPLPFHFPSSSPPLLPPHPASPPTSPYLTLPLLPPHPLSSHLTPSPPTSPPLLPPHPASPPTSPCLSSHLTPSPPTSPPLLPPHPAPHHS